MESGQQFWLSIFVGTTSVFSWVDSGQVENMIEIPEETRGNLGPVENMIEIIGETRDERGISEILGAPWVQPPNEPDQVQPPNEPSYRTYRQRRTVEVSFGQMRRQMDYRR